MSSKCTFWTNACNTSYWCLYISDNALLGWRTWVAHNTRIQASFSHAGELWRAVSINSAFWFFWYHSWKTCILRVRVLKGPKLLPLTLNTRHMAISYQRISAGANLSVISGTAFSTLSTVAWSAKRLTFLSGKTTARNKVTYFSASTVRITTTACLNACN